MRIILYNILNIHKITDLTEISGRGESTLYGHMTIIEHLPNAHLWSFQGKAEHRHKREYAGMEVKVTSLLSLTL